MNRKRTREADSDYDRQVSPLAFARLTMVLAARDDVPCEMPNCTSNALCIVGNGIWPGRYTRACCEAHAQTAEENVHPIPSYQVPGLKTWIG